ncbi:hypothetical protein EVAR_22494_1 [Eumeta japonica]|uniref:Uncharacterized protein n=1 Tax=Eumeta variegata TaxID=151549 RepID=A0A4C1VDJ5_EUMVA|nr:hypothetical protein EVAR_22494_1 [Eumeta japonica]
MSTKRLLKRKRELSKAEIERLPETALAAIVPSKGVKLINEFFNFFVDVLEKHATWINDAILDQPGFRCVLLAGSGPNRFQIREVIYPSKSDKLNIEVEVKNSDDYDKLAVAALVKLPKSSLEVIKNSLPNYRIRDDLITGESMGVTYAVMEPATRGQFRIVDKLSIIGAGNARNVTGKKKRCKSELK